MRTPSYRTSILTVAALVSITLLAQLYCQILKSPDVMLRTRISTASDIPPKITGLRSPCVEMMVEYNVLPFESWGNLPRNLQKSWDQMACSTDITVVKEMYEQYRREYDSSLWDTWNNETKRREAAVIFKIEHLQLVTVVMSRYRESAEKIEWLAKLPQEKFALVLGNREGGLSDLPDSLVNRSVEILPMTANFADEAVVYLQYIILHYDNPDDFLPYTAFIHAEEYPKSHAGGSMPERLRAWKYGVHQYTSLNVNNFQCYLVSQKRSDEELSLLKFLVLQGYPDPFEKHHCLNSHGQFVVSRERILATPKKFYEDLLQYLTEQFGPGSLRYTNAQVRLPGKVEGMNRVPCTSIEGVWHLIFRENFLQTVFINKCDVLDCSMLTQ